MGISEADRFRIYAGRQQTRDVSADAELTRVGPDTPCGEYLRRFWQPITLSSELGELPKTVRLLGEDLVLFRTKQNDLGLLGRHCCHRGTSLEYGIITDDGISCCYHGWHYAVDGTILDTLIDPHPFMASETISIADCAFPGTFTFADQLLPYLGRDSTYGPNLQAWREVAYSHPAVKETTDESGRETVEWIKPLPT